ncbi:helix-turn-helix domain-containing protein [Paenibacillus sp. FSL R7-269]|uniref:helix-turn-helix domain-containing protein n=1 Tax=Paenibacillus sp. FSL R7-269 TaxID=1226755 RepID=UPI0004B38EF8|nr:AraC family transcriptional regulator [Paenibacillus sp. FSL R7-269]
MPGSARFRQSIAFIEEHLHEEIPLEQAAQAGFTSLMQLYRDFYTYTGHSVKEYIRKRRLSVALGMIRSSQRPLAEIAYACGYSSQQALCKYVKSATSLTPLAYQKSTACYFFPRFDSEAVRQVTVSTEILPATIHMKFYSTRHGGIEQQALEALYALLPAYQGRLFGRDGQPQGGLFCYELAVEYGPALMHSLTGSIFRELEVVPERSLTCAKLAVRSDEAEIGLAWDYLYLKWLRTSMFEQDEERYGEEYIRKGSEVKRLILYVPVRKRTDYDKISVSFSEGLEFLAASREGEQAEEEAAAAVMNYCSRHHPEVLRTASMFCVIQHGGRCTCGVRLERGQAVALAGDSGLQILQAPEGRYAVLESSSYGDRGMFIALLESWVEESGCSREGTFPFTTYETVAPGRPDAITMSVWMKLKDVKK